MYCYAVKQMTYSQGRSSVTPYDLIITLKNELVSCSGMTSVKFNSELLYV